VAAAKSWGVPVEEVSLANSVITTARRGRHHHVWPGGPTCCQDALSQDFERPIPAAISWRRELRRILRPDLASSRIAALSHTIMHWRSTHPGELKSGRCGS